MSSVRSEDIRLQVIGFCLKLPNWLNGAIFVRVICNNKLSFPSTLLFILTLTKKEFYVIQNSKGTKEKIGYSEYILCITIPRLSWTTVARAPSPALVSQKATDSTGFFQSDSMYLCIHIPTYTHTEREQDSLHFLCMNGR